MKTLFTICIFLIAHSYFPVMRQKSGTLTVTVTNVENNKGLVRAVLFKGREGFPEESSKAFKSLSAPAREVLTLLVFEDIPYGTYALSILHDQNSDGEMNTNLFGYPQEAYGVSNNKTSALGIPKYEDARFELMEEEKKLLIHLRN